ncbi:MAG: hypothetical protein ACYSUX_19275 [Planctomycetota bacterium]
MSASEGTVLTKSKGHVEFIGSKEVFQFKGDYYIADITAWLDLYTKCRTGARFMGTQAWYEANRHRLAC